MSEQSDILNDPLSRREFIKLGKNRLARVSLSADENSRYSFMPSMNRRQFLKTLGIWTAALIDVGFVDSEFRKNRASYKKI
ncbi:MAG: hypothetical protein US51_C0010G0009 [Microgenomates group bacterium GW2011_GWA2_37_6]|nr:MAG: hypothetical protein US51_C0010G0009 [Microgenomates group bacterium GW2011_GWA2_37_6]